MFSTKLKTLVLIAMLALTAVCSVSTAAAAVSGLHTYAAISDTRPGNITVMAGGRVIITQQPLDGPSLRVVEVTADATQDDAELSAQIERYADKGPSDGFIVDGEGRVFSGNIEQSAIGVSTPEGYEIIAQDDALLSWPDGFAFAADGTLYITQNQLHTHPALNQGVDGSDKNYHILTLKP